MDILTNPYRATGLSHPDLDAMPWPNDNASPVQALLSRCPSHAVTPLVSSPDLALSTNVSEVWIKDERSRMGLRSFKALGAAYVIAVDAQDGLAQGRTYVTASAGNHGLSVAAGAQAFGAKARIYLSKSVPESFADRLRGLGADVRRAGDVYEQAMAAAANAASEEGLELLSDSSWPGYSTRPHRLMEGYLALMAEVVDQIPQPPTHVFLQAGVGGIAAASAAHVRKVWGDAVHVCVVEPEAAPALMASIRAAAPVTTTGPVSDMGRLDCKEPSLIALKGLARDADSFALISEAQGAAGVTAAQDAGLATTASGAAGLAALIACADQREAIGLTSDARVLLILSEEA